MLQVWLPLFAIAFAAWGWYHVLRLRERVIRHARQLCERHGLQFLDESVALHRLRIVRRRGSLHVLREYRFDVSLGGHDRRTASLTLFGERIVSASLPSSDPPVAPPAAAAVTPYVRATLPRGEAASGNPSGNVVPITRARRTLH